MSNLHTVDDNRKAAMITTKHRNDDLLTASEVALLLRMTSGWVYQETRANRIPHLRLGRYVRYRRSAIEEWMGDIESGSTPSALAQLPAGRAEPFARH